MEKRMRHSLEERIAEIDKKMVYHKNRIEKLEQKKESAIKAVNSKSSLKVIIEKARESGLSNEEIAQRLGVENY